MSRELRQVPSDLLRRINGDPTLLGDLFPSIVGNHNEIPYHRLPQRATTVFGSEFRLWDDLAGQSINSLLHTPGAGRNTVEALLYWLDALETLNGGRHPAGGVRQVQLDHIPSDLVRRLDGDSTPLREVFPDIVDNREEIPYDRLPRRAETMFGRRFRVWDDLSDESVDTLLATPRAGTGTVGPLLRELHAVAHVGVDEAGRTGADEDASWILGQRSEFDRQVSLAASWWTARFGSPPTLSALLADWPSDSSDSNVRSALSYLRSLQASVEPSPELPQLIDEFLGHFDQRNVDVLTARRWTRNRRTLNEVGDDLDVTRERIRQIQVSAEAALEKALASNDAAPLRWVLEAVAIDLGALLPLARAEEVLAGRGVVLDTMHGWFVLDHVGEYEVDESGWLIDTSRLVRSAVRGEVQRVFADGITASHSDLLAGVQALGVHPEIAEVLLESEEWIRRLDDQTWVLWEGSAVDRAIVVLKLAGHPLSAEEIVAHLDEDLNVRSMRGRLSSDDRVMRTGKSTLGLVEWGHEEYSGIVEELFERIDRDGGSCEVDGLVAELAATFPDVSENSIRMYMSTLAFVIEGGRIRRRLEGDDWPVEDDLTQATGTFVLPDDRIRLVLTANGDMLRGSGRPIPQALAVALRVRPGERREFLTERGDSVLVSWRPWATSGPTIGSLRVLAEATEAVRGVRVAVDFDVNTAHVSMSLLPSADEDDFLASVLDVRQGANVVAATAAAVGVSEQEVRASLRGRGDAWFAELLPSSISGQLDDVIAGLVAELG